MNSDYSCLYNLSMELALVQEQQGYSEEAVATLKAAATLFPDESSLLIRLGAIMNGRGEPGEAMRYYLSALERCPANLRLHHELALILEKRGQISEAIRHWEYAHGLNDRDVHSLSLVAMLKDPATTRERLLEAHQEWARRFAIPRFYKANYNFPAFHHDRKINVGYACSFWDSDTIRFQLLPILRRHDRARFKIFAYTGTYPGNDVLGAVDEVRVAGHLTDDEYIDLTRSDGIDVLVELNGHSPGHRFAAMASRCAPVQVSYLNYTSTCGVPAVDYIITDAVAAGPDEDAYYTEQIYRLDDCFFCFAYEGENLPETGPVPAIGNGFVTFGCFGSGGKINDQLIAVWAEILKKLPGSQILLRNNELSAVGNRRFMKERFAKHGIQDDRVQVLAGTDRKKVLQTYQRVDISLDTHPYCGGNTIAESLWQGVPVITWQGGRFSSAYGASMLVAAGCPELVAPSASEYIDKAVTLGRDIGRLSHYRKSLRQMAVRHGLSDPVRFARKLDKAFVDMLERRSSAHGRGAYARAIRQVEQAVASNAPEYRDELLTKTWPLEYAKVEYSELNRFLFDLSTRGLGINNCGSFELSGEDWLLDQLVRIYQAEETITVFDVGAHKGDYVALLAKKLGNARVFAFEPANDAFAVLASRFRESRILPRQVALADRMGSGMIYNHGAIDAADGQHCSLYPGLFESHYRSKSKHEEVQLSTLDAFCAENNIARIHFLKIDTEGSELGVLRGAARMLSEARVEVVQFEFNYTNLYSRVFFSDLTDCLGDFSLYRLLPKGLLPIRNEDYVGNHIYQYQNIIAFSRGRYAEGRRMSKGR